MHPLRKILAFLPPHALPLLRLRTVSRALRQQADKEAPGVALKPLRGLSVGRIAEIAVTAGRTFNVTELDLEVCYPDRCWELGASEERKAFKSVLASFAGLCRLRLLYDSMGVREVEMLAGELATMPKLTSLHVTVQNAAWERFARELEQCSQLKELTLHAKLFDAPAVAAALPRLLHLQTLCLSSCHLDDEDMQELEASLEVLPLRELDLASNWLSEESGECLERMLDAQPRLQVLSVKDNMLGDEGVQAVARAVCRHTALRILDLCRVGMGAQGVHCVVAVVSKCHTLLQLSLGMDFADNSALEVLSTLDDNKVPALGTDSAGASALGDNNVPTLGMDLTDASALRNNTVPTLGVDLTDAPTLDENNVPTLGTDSAGAPTLDEKNVQALALRDLRMAGALGRCCSRVQCAKGVGALLSKCPHMQHLALCQSNITGCCHLLTAGLQQSGAALCVLALEWCAVSMDDARDIAGMLARMPSLRKLLLAHNALCPEATQVLASALPSVKALDTLDLGDNRIGDAGLHAVVGVLPHLKSLECLRVQDNNISDVRNLMAAVALNPSLHEVQVRSPWRPSRALAAKMESACAFGT